MVATQTSDAWVAPLVLEQDWIIMFKSFAPVAEDAEGCKEARKRLAKPKAHSLIRRCLDGTMSSGRFRGTTPRMMVPDRKLHLLPPAAFVRARDEGGFGPGTRITETGDSTRISEKRRVPRRSRPGLGETFPSSFREFARGAEAPRRPPEGLPPIQAERVAADTRKGRRATFLERPALSGATIRAPERGFKAPRS